MGLGRWVFLNESFVEADAARISPFDRGYLFAHAAYEVTAVYNGQFVDFERHLDRLKRTLDAIDVSFPLPDLKALHEELIARNDLSEGLVYLQVSAGNQGPRDFYGPETIEPSLFMFSTAKPLIDDVARHGVAAITLEDTRWKRRDLKTTQLLSQSLAYREARRANAHTALMHEEGLITEAASANVWMVTETGTLLTRDLSEALLPGITRERTLTLAAKAGFQLEERAFSIDEIQAAIEIFTTSTGMVILPIIQLDGSPVGTGIPGTITRAVQRLYYESIGANIDQIAPWAAE